MLRWTQLCFPCFCTPCLMQCYVHRSTNSCFPYCCTVWSIVTCTVGHTVVFPALFILFDPVLHAPLDTIVFSLFVYILFYAELHALLIRLVFSLFLYILFDAVLHSPLDTLVFSLFYSYCLKQCYMLRWTQLCFPCFCTYCLIQCCMHLWTHWRFPDFFSHCLMQCYVYLWTHWRFPYFCTYCLNQCYMHLWTHWSFPNSVHTVWCSVAYSVGHNGVFSDLRILFYPVLHAPLTTLAFSVFFFHAVWCSVTRTVGHTSVFHVFVHTVWCIVTCTVGPTSVFRVFVHYIWCSVTCSVGQTGFFVFLYILFDPVLHAELDTLVFSLFYTYCLIHCNMHSWTHCCFLCFIHTVWSSVTCTVGHNCVDRFLYFLFYAELYAQLIRLVFPCFCTYCFIQCCMWFFCKYVLCSVTCTVGHTVVFFVLFINTVWCFIQC